MSDSSEYIALRITVVLIKVEINLETPFLSIETKPTLPSEESEKLVPLPMEQKEFLVR